LESRGIYENNIRNNESTNEKRCIKKFILFWNDLVKKNQNTFCQEYRREIDEQFMEEKREGILQKWIQKAKAQQNERCQSLYNDYGKEGTWMKFYLMENESPIIVIIILIIYIDNRCHWIYFKNKYEQNM